MPDTIELTVRPTTGAPLSSEQLDRLARTANADSSQLADDGSGRLSFASARYDPETARGNLEMAARMVLGAHWQTRYEVGED